MIASGDVKKYTEPISIFLVWLFTLSAIIGISIGYFEWFIVKTPLNLIIIFSLLLLNFPIDSAKKIGLVILFFVTGFMAEWIGVHYGFLFGEYHYGQNLGIRIDGIPILIGANWVVLTLASAGIIQNYFTNLWIKVILSSLLMVFIDFFIEPAAPIFDFWYWKEGYASMHNFLGWFAIALLLHFIYVKSNIQGSFRFSANVYLAQLLFFVYFYFYHGI